MTPSVGDGRKNAKLRGEWVELKFMLRAQEEGLVVSKPWGESMRYDFVVEHAGKLHRVQVKSVSKSPVEQRRRGGYLCSLDQRRFSSRTKTYSKSRLYTKEEIEFFAFYIVPEDVWFIVPVTFTRTGMLLCPHQPKSKHYQYREAWDLLKS